MRRYRGRQQSPRREHLGRIESPPNPGCSKTVTRLLTPAQYQAYAPWFANTRRLRELAAELQALSLAEMARAEGWATITPGTPAPPRTRPVRGPNPNYPKPPKTPGDQPA